MNNSIKEEIDRVSKKDNTSSQGWIDMTKNLKEFLENGDIDSYYKDEIEPHVFNWPENGRQTKKQLSFLERNKDSVFYKTIMKTNDYGPLGIPLYKGVQLDRVQQVWSIYNLVNILGLNLNSDEIIFEFGGGTGQMADVLSDLDFKGIHIVYDLPLMTVLQKNVIDRRNIKTRYIVDEEELYFIRNGVNYLPANQINSEEMIMMLPNINFIATYSLSETDIDTHNKFAKYMPNFSRIIIIYLPNRIEEFGNIDNEDYIQKIKREIEKTHHSLVVEDYGGNGNVFYAVKKSISNGISLSPGM